jgi:hypothetical protein
MGAALRRVGMALWGVPRRNAPGTVARGGGGSQRAKSGSRRVGQTGTRPGVLRLNSYVCRRRDSGYRGSGFRQLADNCRLDPDGSQGRTEADGRLGIGIHRDGPVQLF